MKMLLLVLMFVLFLSHSFAQKTNVYLFHGQGSDYRIFSKLKLDTNLFDTTFIDYPKMVRKISLDAYSKLIAPQIDTSQNYSFIGVSFGGMVVSELTKILNPHKAIIVSSAQNKNEIPSRYKFMKVIPIHKLVPAFIYKGGARIAQPIFEPDRKKEKAIFKAMLKDKEAYFLKGVTKMMINWENYEFDENIIHIHGTKDHTLPIKKVNANYVIKNGSHMMMLTRPNEINQLINSILIN